MPIGAGDPDDLGGLDGLDGDEEDEEEITGFSPPPLPVEPEAEPVASESHII